MKKLLICIFLMLPSLAFSQTENMSTQLNIGFGPEYQLGAGFELRIKTGDLNTSITPIFGTAIGLEFKIGKQKGKFEPSISMFGSKSLTAESGISFFGLGFKVGHDVGDKNGFVFNYGLSVAKSTYSSGGCVGGCSGIAGGLLPVPSLQIGYRFD